jgi:hypothetical protein
MFIMILIETKPGSAPHTSLRGFNTLLPWQNAICPLAGKLSG